VKDSWHTPSYEPKGYLKTTAW